MMNQNECSNCMRMDVCGIEKLADELRYAFKQIAILCDSQGNCIECKFSQVQDDGLRRCKLDHEYEAAKILYSRGIRPADAPSNGMGDYVAVFVNTCYGAFNLSDDFLVTYNLTPQEGVDISRTDPRLLEYYLAHNGGLSGANARIRPQFLRKGTKYIIAEYDGKESIKTEADLKFIIAGEEN